MNKGIYIVVRTGSSRLSQKALSKVCGKYIIEILIDRMKFINENNADIVICTTDNPDDDVFETIARENEVYVFRGSENNIVKRQYDCSVFFGHDFIVNVDGDDILCDPEYVKKILYRFTENPDIDVITTVSLPFGVNSMGYRKSVLKRILDHIEKNELDTGWGELIKNKKMFKIEEIFPETESERIEVRLSLDYDEDLEVFRKIIESKYQMGTFLSQKEVNDFLRGNPSIALINKGVEEKYWENYKKNKSWSEDYD